MKSYYYFNSSIDSSISNSIALGFQIIVAALFYGIFSLEVDNIGALFSLFPRMSAHINQGFNDPFEGVDLVVPDDETTGFFFAGKEIRFFTAIGK